MTPAARIAAAIELLDRISGGAPAEQALTTWARGNRFAGSKDRAAIRDHVFDALRHRSSFGVLGGGEDGRALMIGALRAAGRDPAEVFTGEGYAPAPLTSEEAAHTPPPEADWPRPVRLDYPAWLEGELVRSLGEDLEPVMEALKTRAPVFLRVNAARTDRETARATLLEDGVVAVPHPLASTALEVTENARAIRRSRAWLSGLVDLQDASSQAVVEALGAPTGRGRALDYCAGGGGKTLALAALGWRVTAHDAEPRRMADLPARATRAGAEVEMVGADMLPGQAPFDLVLADAPCSGSGAWRRQAEARWRLVPEGLDALAALQDTVLDAAAAHVAPGGRLAYATCSLLRCENDDRIEAFVSRHSGWRSPRSYRFSPLDDGDGFYLSVLEKC